MASEETAFAAWASAEQGWVVLVSLALALAVEVWAQVLAQDAASQDAWLSLGAAAASRL